MYTVLRILFDGLDDQVVDADVRVVVEDLSEADAPAPVLGRWLFSGQSISADQPMVEVGIDPDLADKSNNASVRVHVDLDGSRSIAAGDFVSTSVVRLSDPPPSADLSVADKTTSDGPLERRTIVVHVERV